MHTRSKIDQEIRGLWQEGLSTEVSEKLFKGLELASKAEVSPSLKRALLSGEPRKNSLWNVRVTWVLAPLAAALIAFALIPQRMHSADTLTSASLTEQQQYEEIALLASEFMGVSLADSFDQVGAFDFIYQDQSI